MDMTTRRLAELQTKPIPGKLNIAHLQAIHHHIFQDLYPWAGLFRTINIARSGQFFFALSEHIAPALEDLFDKLNRERQLAGTDQTAFANRAAFYMGELNAIHPFRDGNGRA
jgi:cell filamentation protein